MMRYPVVSVEFTYGQILILKHALKNMPNSLMLGGGQEDGIPFPVTSIVEIEEMLCKAVDKMKE